MFVLVFGVAFTSVVADSRLCGPCPAQVFCAALFLIACGFSGKAKPSAHKMAAVRWMVFGKSTFSARRVSGRAPCAQLWLAPLGLRCGRCLASPFMSAIRDIHLSAKKSLYVGFFVMLGTI